MKKRILLLSQYFPPETNACANRLESMARILSNDYDVHVVTLKPSNPSPTHYKALPLKPHDSRLPYKVQPSYFHSILVEASS